MKTRWVVYNLGSFSTVGEVIKFAYVAPSYVKRLLALNVYCPQLANMPPLKEDVQVSVLVNNEAQIPVCSTFSLGMNNTDENIEAGRPLPLDIPINKGEYISGYVEKLNISGGIGLTEIKLHILCELYEPNSI